jgi:hypothetical protein
LKYNLYLIENIYFNTFIPIPDDIFPIGWCDMYGYKLEPPKGEEADLEPPAKKKK